jgi:hypothetical protein
MKSIESIPPEIIAMILRECIRAIDIRPYGNLPSVMTVCRQWRMLALDHTDCWSVIHVTGAGYYGSEELSRYGAPDKALNVRILRWLCLARNHPVDVSIWSSPWQSDLDLTESISWKVIASKLSNTPNISTYWEIERSHILNFLPSFPPESFRALTHLRLNRSNVLRKPVPLPQLKVFCSNSPPDGSLYCPLMESFTIAPLFSNHYPISLVMMAKRVQSFPKVEKLVFDEIYSVDISSEDILKCRDAFSKIHHLGVGSVSPRTLLDLLSCFSSASTLTISDITHIKTSVPFNGKNLKELVLLEHPSWQRVPRRDTRWQESLAWRFFDCLPELRTFRIGRRMHFEDLCFKFYWPHHRNNSTVRWLPKVLSAYLCALGLRKDRDSTLLPFRCPQLEHIHLTCIHLDDTFIEYLMDCLRLRHENEDTAVKKTRISTTKCTSDVGSASAFPDVSGLSCPEFKQVFDKHDVESKMLGCLFDPL